ncbi:MAG: methyltransferase domain-containing protein [bacterium]|nr:methyltransferase domain-containing protein [bacterium]
MLTSATIKHFESIAPTWKRKGWVNSSLLNGAIDKFVRQTEQKIGLHRKKYKTGLYFGIGTGALFRYFQNYNLAGIDGSANMLQQCPEGIVQILSQIEELPFLMNNQFHLSFCRNLLKHCEDPLEAVRSMYEKTRQGCIAIAVESVVLKSEDKVIPTTLVRMTDNSHPSFLTVDEIVNLFKKAGFLKVDYNVFQHRASWLKRWVEAEGASLEIQKNIVEFTSVWLITQ